MKKYLILVTLLIVGCAGAPEPTKAPATATSTAIPPSATNTPLPPTPTDVPSTPTALPLYTAETVNIEGANELEIVGTLYTPTDNSSEPRPALLLLHMFMGTRREWRTVAPQLAEAGYVVLTIDQRGHGATGGTANWIEAEEDHKLAVEFLMSVPSVDAERLGVMGGSIGANMALVAGAMDENVSLSVLLSPGLDYFGVTSADKLPAYGERPLMIVASRNDGQTVPDAEVLVSQAKGEVELVIYDTAGHGTRMFLVEPELVDIILEWLAEHL